MQAEITYNWDDIEVGRFDLNHSENFFTQKHLKHEKFSEEFDLVREMATNLSEEFCKKLAMNDGEDKENAQPVVKIMQHEVKQQIKSPLLTKDPSNPESQKKPSAEVKSSTLMTSNTNRRPANLITRPKTPQPQVKTSNAVPSAVGKNGKPPTKAEPPHAYEFKDIYQKKKEEKMKKLLEEEKKNRIFHSKPVPKSVTAPQQPLLQKALINSKLTNPRTPVVLKNSREADERRRQRIEEWKKNNAPVKFTSREAIVLQEEPFKPKKSGQTVQMQPFNLHVEKRLEERKQYDEQHRRAAEEKKKQEEEERKKREEELVKEIRKLASFKARPNPFK